ncbi:MAG: acyltransferase [Oleiphilaceae bacterium]|nr:acyltransferase [Oleiphilaceae bacterium]
MLHFIPGPIKGLIVTLLIIINTLFWFPPLLLAAITKALLPISIIRVTATKLAIAMATNWISFNSFLFTVFHKIEWQIEGLEQLEKNQWYLVNCNHQSWADIPIVQKILNRRIPMLKFFLKQELIWVPVIGLCWWALDFPFMKRYSAQQIRNNPELAGKDLETTRKACEKFKDTPVSVFNFLEGTRFTPAKHAKQESPYTHLLKPKAGGAAFVLGSMGEQMHTMLDISIAYPEHKNGMWDLCCGRIDRVIVKIEKIEIPKEFLGKDYTQDQAFKSAFQEWVNTLWERKDQQLGELKARQTQ